MLRSFLSVGGLCCGLIVRHAIGADIPGGQLTFFETKVRPILAEHCYQCHSVQKNPPKGSLELDWRGGWEKGGASGPTVLPGDPENSLLIQAVRYTNPDLQMPPKGQKLTAQQVNDLVGWVKMGAPDPRVTKPTGSTAASSQSKNHWAFQPIRKPTVPQIGHTNWVHNEIDHYILAKLESEGLTASPPAEPYTLLRRVYFDLIGLPPTPEQVSAFIRDHSTNAFEKVVDHLLASPEYGERWGRHWLDVARYSDSKGQFDRRRESAMYPYAWTYRDYVIRAFNDDKPYNRFVVEQLAADRLPPSTNSTTLAALGFLTLGDRFNGNPNDIINDRIDVTTKAFLGLTVSCARCHDHKFDPISQADYYALHGVFASSVEPAIKPEIAPPSDSSRHNDYLEQRRKLEAQLLKLRTESLTNAFGDYKRLAGVYIYATQMPLKDRDAYLAKMGARTNVLKNWQQVVRNGGSQASSIFGLWNVLSRIPADRFGNQASRLLANLDQRERLQQLNPFVTQAFRGKAPRTLAEAAAIYGSLFATEEPSWQTTLTALMGDAAIRFLPNRERAQYSGLRERIDLLELSHPGAPARAPVLLDSAMAKDSPIFIRGEAENRGRVVPRRFLEILSPVSNKTFQQGSGRLELAQSIANPVNPLTARVWVNRVWQHHFGDGFVATPDDFGNQSTPPSHPELLDYLANRFIQEGWSTKRLHKLILLSATFQQSSANCDTVAREKDPGNRLLWRANVRRLEFEPLRDSLLFFSGGLDQKVGGHSIDLSQGQARLSKRRTAQMGRDSEFRTGGSSRRSIYGFVDRSDLLEDMNTFDFANPAIPMGKRYETTSPQQGLYLMNSPLVAEQIQKIANRPDLKRKTDPKERIQLLYSLFFQHPASEQQVRLGVSYIEQFTQDSSETGESLRNRAWENYIQALLLTNEAGFVD